ncbi:MAG: DegT/DnrJ/EryC1/StrS family aminotransferase [Planctomycetota bacterium]
MGKHRSIAISAPDLTECERRYLLEAFDSSWISSTGRFVDEFESRFARQVGARHGLSCTNGTCALHLALLALDVGPGDEVIVPDQTYVSTANAVHYVGATPVFADCDPDTWTIDPHSVSRLITDRTRAVIPVHLFGVPADLTQLVSLADEASVAIVEDAAEAHGARWRDRPVGSWGHLSTFSFYGNKIVATGEGGMVCTNDDYLADRVSKLKGQGADPLRRYYFDEVGYNYRMTNLSCAIGLAQMERLEEMLERRLAVGAWYDRALRDLSLPIKSQAAPDEAQSVLWMYGVVLSEEFGTDRDTLASLLAAAGIETRPFFHSLNTLPMYRDCRSDRGCPVSRRVADAGLMLPTHTSITEEDVSHIMQEIARAAERQQVLS